MKTILVPTDFSKVAKMATDVAFDLAKKAGARIILLHVIDGVTQGSFNVEGQIASPSDYTDKLFTFKLIEKAKNQITKFVNDPKYADAQVDGELKLGNPFHGMQTIISAYKVDLVVMGTAGGSGLEELLLGSNTEKVIRHSHCPVLTVSQKPKVTNFKNIVYATSLSEDEELFSRIVRRSQVLYDSTIHLVRINTPGDFIPDYTTHLRLEKFVKKIGLKNYTLNTYNDFSIANGAMRFAEKIKGDLIAIATHARSSVAHAFSGSVAEEVVSQSTCPVLTYVIH